MITFFAGEDNDLMASVTDLPKDYVQEIGFLAVETAWLDRAVLGFVAELAFSDEESTIQTKKAECLVGGENSSILLKKLKKLFIIVIDDAPLRSEFNNIFKSIENVYKDRGVYVHSCLSYSEGWKNVPPEVKGFRIKREMDKKTNEMREKIDAPLPALVKAATDARNTFNELIRFRLKVHKHLRSEKSGK